ncbi:MAG: YqjK family protein [Pseudomonadota bacterium]
MHNTSQHQLLQRRQQLIALSTVQRQVLANRKQNLTNSLIIVETGLQLAQRIRQHPVLFGALALCLARVQPQGVARLIQTGSVIWQTWRGIMPVLHQDR